MKIYYLCGAALLAACVTQTESTPSAQQCAAPHLVASELRIGDGALDRGFIGGVSFADVDGDGDQDLYAARGYDVNQTARPIHLDRSMLYLNDGHGHFERAEDNALSNNSEPASGSAWGDVDHDGDLDVFVATQLGRRDAFYRNLGSGRFAREDLGDASSTPGGNFNASWVDIDGDGDLDLVSGGPTLEPGAPNLVYRNDGGRFARVTGTPLDNGASNAGVILWADFDNDGDQDLFVANSDVAALSDVTRAEIETSQLYRNDGAWHFVRTSGQGFDAPGFPAMSAAAGDIDNDGDLDLFYQIFPGGDLAGGRHRSFGDRIFINDGSGRFSVDPAFIGPEHADVVSGGALADFDLDGDLDLVYANFNGGILLFTNDGHGRFAAVNDPALTGRVNTHAGFAAADIDGDGDIDVAIGNWGETHEGNFVTILRNESAPCGEPVRVRLRDRFGAPDPIGARTVLVTRGVNGERRQVREVIGQTSFRGQSADQLSFGVPVGERVVRLEIRWPNGGRQIVRRVRAGVLNEFTAPAR